MVAKISYVKQRDLRAGPAMAFIRPEQGVEEPPAQESERP